MVSIFPGQKDIKRYKISKILIGLALCLSTSSLYSQFLKDSASVNLIRKGIDNVYNFQFEKADKVSEELGKYIPDIL